MRDDIVTNDRKPFTLEHVKDRELVIKMLSYEDTQMLGLPGKHIFKDLSLHHLTSLETYYIFHRMTLAAHGFSTTDEDVANYRKIFSNYYNSPHSYDAQVLGSVCYMRQNKCVYYDAPLLSVGDEAPDVELLTLEGLSTSLSSLMTAHPHKYVFVGAFSNS